MPLRNRLDMGDISSLLPLLTPRGGDVTQGGVGFTPLPQQQPLLTPHLPQGSNPLPLAPPQMEQPLLTPRGPSDIPQGGTQTGSAASGLQTLAPYISQIVNPGGGRMPGAFPQNRLGTGNPQGGGMTAPPQSEPLITPHFPASNIDPPGAGPNGLPPATGGQPGSPGQGMSPHVNIGALLQSILPMLQGGMGGQGGGLQGLLSMLMGQRGGAGNPGGPQVYPGGNVSGRLPQAFPQQGLGTGNGSSFLRPEIQPPLITPRFPPNGGGGMGNNMNPGIMRLLSGLGSNMQFYMPRNLSGMVGPGGTFMGGAGPVVGPGTGQRGGLPGTRSSVGDGSENPNPGNRTRPFNPHREIPDALGGDDNPGSANNTSVTLAPPVSLRQNFPRRSRFEEG